MFQECSHRGLKEGEWVIISKVTHGLPFDTWSLSIKCVTVKKKVCFFFIFRIQSSSEARLQALRLVISKLPQANFDNLRYLIKFLSELSRNQEVHKMTPQNIAIVIAPNLIWSQADETTTMGWAYYIHSHWLCNINPYPTVFPYGNGMVLHFYQQQESSTTKTVHKVINKRLKTYV